MTGTERNAIEISFGDITDKNVGQLKILNSSIFPVRYNAKFYSDLQNHLEYSKLAYHTDILVGAVCCRIEQPQADQVGGVGKRLYIMTLGVLAPYREAGIGAQLLEFALGICKKNPQIGAIYLHVQTTNEDAIRFYKKFGFEIIETIPNYYKRIDNPDCHVLQKNLKH